MDTFVKILSTAVITGLFSSFLTVWFTRKNLRTSKYIETITSERIKWIESVRNDFSILITSISIIRNNQGKYHSVKFESERLAYANHLTMKDNHDDEELYSDYESQRLISEIDIALKKCLSPAEIVMKSTQLQLKLNPDKDIDIYSILVLISSEFSQVDFNIKESKIDLSNLVVLVQRLLKSNWNKVKQEVKKK